MNAPTQHAENVHQTRFPAASPSGGATHGSSGVHLLVGWLALQLAFGDKKDQASSSGAMSYLAQQPLGGFLVWAIAIGMVFLVIWRLLEFAFGYPEESDEKNRWRKRGTSLL